MSGLIQRDNLAGLIPEPVSREIFQGVVEQSAVLKYGRRLPNMTSKTQSINVLDMLPMAYWVEGDTGYKETSSQAWEKKRLFAEELAVIIPIPEAVLDDSNYDIWGEVKPRIVEAMGRRIDEAILFGIGRPSTWRHGIVKTAKDAGNFVKAHAGTSADPEDVFGDIMGVGGVIAKAEESGYMPTGVMAAVQMRAKLRGLTDTTGQPIFVSSMQSKTPYMLDVLPDERILGPGGGADDRRRLPSAGLLHPPGRDLQGPDRGDHRGSRQPQRGLFPGPAGHGGAPRGYSSGLGDPESHQRLP